MKKFIAILMILSGVSANAQLKGLIQNPIRKINVNIDKRSTTKIINPPAKSQNAKTASIKGKIAGVDENSVTIINENAQDIVFAIGSTDMMSNETVTPQNIVNLPTIDPWTNIILRTGDKHAAYSIKSGNCFKIYWNRGSSIWDLQKAKCDVYEKSEIK